MVTVIKQFQNFTANKVLTNTRLLFVRALESRLRSHKKVSKHYRLETKRMQCKSTTVTIAWTKSLFWSSLGVSGQYPMREKNTTRSCEMICVNFRTVIINLL